MRLFLLIATFVVASLPTYACGGGSDDSPPPRIVKITGERAACNGTRFVYQVEVANTDELTLSVIGGTISPVSAPLTGICGGVPNPAQPNSRTLIYTPNQGGCSFAISAVINWNSNGTRRLTATVRRGGTTRTSTVTFTGNVPTVSGPPSPICLDDFGGNSFLFTSTGPPEASVQWSVGATSSGPLTISSPNSRNTQVSGFDPNGFYTLEVTYTCPGQSPITRSTSVQTRAFDDPECNPFGNCPDPNDIICQEQVREQQEETRAQAETGLITSGKEGLLGGQTLPALTNGRSQGDYAAVIVYPNPVAASQSLTVEIPTTSVEEAIPTLVRLVDFSGRIIQQTEVVQSRLEIPTVDVPPGSYLIQIIQGEWVATTKLVVSPR